MDTFALCVHVDSCVMPEKLDRNDRDVNSHQEWTWMRNQVKFILQILLLTVSKVLIDTNMSKFEIIWVLGYSRKGGTSQSPIWPHTWRSWVSRLNGRHLNQSIEHMLYIYTDEVRRNLISESESGRHFQVHFIYCPYHWKWI